MTRSRLVRRLGEQRAFEKVQPSTASQAGVTLDGYKQVSGAIAQPVQGVNDYFLAGAGFVKQLDVGLCWRHRPIV